MTLYNALKYMAFEIEEFTVVFPDGFGWKSENFGCSGAAISCIAEEAPRAFTLTVKDIVVKDDDCRDATIYTEYGPSYRADIEQVLMGVDEETAPDVETAIKMMALADKKAEKFTLEECNEIAKLADTTIYEVIETLGQRTI